MTSPIEPGLGTLRRVRQVARQHPHLALADVDPAGTVVGHHVDVDVALDLVEELLVGVDVVVGALVRPADDHRDEVGAGREQLLVADRRLEQVAVLRDPLLEVDVWFTSLITLLHSFGRAPCRDSTAMPCISMQQVRVGQLAHGDRRPRRPGRLVEELAVDLVVPGEVVHVDEERRHRDEVGRGSAPTAARTPRMFSSTARVCTRMSSWTCRRRRRRRRRSCRQPGGCSCPTRTPSHRRA